MVGTPRWSLNQSRSGLPRNAAGDIHYLRDDNGDGPPIYYEYDPARHGPTDHYYHNHYGATHLHYHDAYGDDDHDPYEHVEFHGPPAGDDDEYDWFPPDGYDYD